MKLVKYGDIIFDAEKIIKAEYGAQTLQIWLVDSGSKDFTFPAVSIEGEEANQLWAWLKSELTLDLSSSESET